MQIQDTYFTNSYLALKEAMLNNKVLAPNKQVEATQLCYYDGDILENAPRNCINVKFNDFVSYFKKTKNRLPTKIQTQNKLLKEQFDKKLIFVDEQINKKIQILENKTKNQKPNFKDKKLRIFAHACRETILIKHQIISIMNSAKSLGFEVYVHKQDSDLQSCSRLAYLEVFSKFNPHITVSINHINNKHLNDSVYNFVWFQDSMPILRDDKIVKLRNNDTIFHLTDGLKKLLLIKNIKSTYQPFCIDTTIYRHRKDIQRDKEIVFIGSSNYSEYININHPKKKVLCMLLWSEFLLDGIISKQRRNHVMKEYNISNIDVGYILNYIERDLSLLYIIKNNKKYNIDIYGKGWDIYSEIEKNYMGTLSYGENISKMYNRYKYTLVLSGYVLQQRTIESSASGCIPIVIDSRHNKNSENEKCFEKSLLFIKTLDDLNNILKKKYSLDLDCIVKENNYDKFIKNIISKLM